MKLPLEKNDLPHPPAFKKLLGPSFIVLGLGLGSGEIILWPYLTSNYGLGMVWAIAIGVIMQFFINMEVERYALIYGESMFVGFARWLRWLPLWFAFSTLIGFGWPGIGLAGATLISHTMPGISPQTIGVISFISIGVLLSVGKTLYKTVESLQKTLILIGTPAILLLTLYLASANDYAELAKGLVGIGNNFSFLPKNLALATFLSALVYSGAGGNLNLAQGNYIRDKGYGMGVYADKIKNLFNIDASVKITGTTFDISKENMNRFHKWWRLINLEHFIIFVVLGIITMIALSFLAYVTVFHQQNNAEGISFVINQSIVVGQKTLPVVATGFLIVLGLMLTATQLTVLDSTSRIISENLLLLKGAAAKHLPKMYYLTLWGQILLGIGIFLFAFSQPRQLITISAVINAATMCIYILLLVIHHNRHLKPELRPSKIRGLILIASSLLFGSLFFLTIKQL